MYVIALENKLQQNMVQAVQDMAAYFGCSLAGENTAADAVLRLSFDGRVVRALLVRGAGYFLGNVPCQELQQSYADGWPSGEITRCVKLAVIKVLSSWLRQRPELPWGVLTGVRPGKLAHKIVGAGHSYEKLPQLLQQHYLLPEPQAKLLTDICALQDKLAPVDEMGIYVGVPFCPSRCSYCSFPSGIIPRDEESQQNFVNLIELELQSVVQLTGMHNLRVTSVYVGGGTPTSLSDRVFARFMGLLQSYLNLPTVKEFTVEAGRPDCFSRAKLAAMEEAAVNRISVNPQTFHDATLRAIGRAHTVADFYAAYELVRQSSIPIVNMDLIIGLPGEGVKEITSSLREAVRLAPENLTVHTLTLKKNSPLYSIGHGDALSPAEAGCMVELGQRLATEAGYHPYYLYRQHYMLGHLANIGYAKPGTESIYNIQVMEERHPILGIGPSSASKRPLADGHHLLRMNMPKNLETYRQALQEYCRKREELFREES